MKLQKTNSKADTKAKKLGIILKEAREKVGMSAEDMAFKTRLTRQQIYNYESGKTNPTIEKARQLCSDYKVNLQDTLEDAGYFDLDMNR